MCRSLGDIYLNWDNSDDRRRLLRGPASLAETLQLDRLRAKPPVAVLDELHKPYEPADCFKVQQPVVVPAKTFLSQLL